MTNFVFKDADDIDLRYRFPETVAGYEQWLLLIALIVDATERLGPEGQAFDTEVLDALSNFIAEIDGRYRTRNTKKVPKTCRVFVSHQKANHKEAEAVAWHAHQAGFEYWLDTHDRGLKIANTAPLTATAKAVMIAAIIEMGLLNCSHLCAIRTAKTAVSAWVPYEYGRSKARGIHSRQVATWFETGVGFGPADYLRLGSCLYSTGDVQTWLKTQAGKGCRMPTRQRPWNGSPPSDLPN